MTESDPVLNLLRELRDRDVARDKLYEQWETERRQADERNRAHQAKIELAVRELKTEMQRQDGQIQGLDRRISGNYIGISEQLNLLHDDNTAHREALGNIETATVELSKSSQVLHGRWIEESSHMRGRVTTIEDSVAGVDQRMVKLEQAARALEKRVAEQEPPSVESVEAASGG